MRVLKILLFSRTLNIGGAERQLTLLAINLHQRGIQVAVMVFYGGGPFQKELINAGVKVIDLQKKGRWEVLDFVYRTIARINEFHPDVVYCFIGTSILSVMIRSFLKKGKIVWGIRASSMDMTKYDWFSRLMSRLGIIFSRYSDAIICNSQAGKKYILSQGYQNGNITVIENGIDSECFQFDLKKRKALRNAWGVGDNIILAGIVARLDPMKDHENFLNAAKLCSIRLPNIRFVCIGSGEPSFVHMLQEKSKTIGLDAKLIWAGQHSDLSAVYSALDLLVSSSYTEAFPNVVAEGMSCGLPIVTTNAGECELIVDKFGWVVPVNNPEALANAMIIAADASSSWQKSLSRQHIVENYSVQTMVNTTLTFLHKVVMS
jgi:glycosyltransferase involved in cell wall biosynthesis